MGCDVIAETDFDGGLNATMTFKSSSTASTISFIPDESIKSNYTFDNDKLTIKKTFGKGQTSLGKVKSSVAVTDTKNDNPGDTKTITVSNISITNSSGEAIKGNDTKGSTYLYSETMGLKSLTVSGVSFEYLKYKLNYDLTVLSSVSSVTVKAEKLDSSDVVTVNGKELDASKGNTVNLNYGKNTIAVLVTDKNGVKKPYTLNITRLEEGEKVPEKGKNNYLTKIKFLGYEIDFDKNKTDYSIVVDNKVNKFALCSDNVVDDKYLCLAVDDFLISTGKNFAIDGEDFYMIFNDISDDEYLESLENMMENVIVKENDKGGYDAYIGDELIWQTDKGGNYLYIKTWYGDLKVGQNALKVIVVAENGDERTYTFNIERKGSDNKLLTENEIEKSPSTGSLLIIGACIVLVISLGGTIYFIYKKNKNKNIDDASNKLKN